LTIQTVWHQDVLSEMAETFQSKVRP